MNPVILGTLLLMVSQAQVHAVASMHLPTSDAIDVARRLARDLGYPIDQSPRRFFFDLATGEGGQPLIAGYTTVGFFGDPQPIHHFAINEQSGQIVDADLCALFDFPDLRAFARRRRQLSGARARTADELAREIGCDALKGVRTPMVPKT